MSSDYHPIPCETYAELEVAILHGTRLRVCWMTETGDLCLSSLLPIDLRVYQREEFLVAQDPLQFKLHIRLDRIRRFAPI